MQIRSVLFWLFQTLTSFANGLSAERRGNWLAIILASLFVLSACSAIEGYPTDPENSSTVLSALSTYFDPSIDYQYNQFSDPIARRQLRDTIVLNRMRAYDIEFDRFERDLYGQANGIETVGDLTVIAAGAVGAVSGAAITKSAINAGTSAVTGAQGKITTDLFYQRTLPAIISQMEANRTKIKTGILIGLKESDSTYPLAAAYMDLESLKNAGGIPPAVSAVTQSASADAQNANEQLQVVSTEAFRTSVSSSGTTLQNWLIKGGGGIAANSAQLRSWMDGHGLKGARFQEFLNQPAYEAQREQAIKSLVK